MRLLLQVLPTSLALAVAAAGPVAAQEDAPPAPEIVAQVGEEAIGKAEFDEWLAQATHAQFRRPVEMVPPRYRQCVAATFLVQSRWVEQEAESRGVDVSPARVDRVFRRQKRQAFRTKRAYRRFLHTSGATESGIKQRVRLDLLQNALTRIAISKVAPVTRRDIARYRANHRRRFAGMRRAEANRRIRALLVSRREQRALTRVIVDFRDRYAAITWCAPGHQIDDCGAPAPA